MVEGMVKGPIGGRGAIAPVLLRGPPGFRRPRWPKIDFFLLERSPRTVLQLIPKDWGSAANRNLP